MRTPYLFFCLALGLLVGCSAAPPRVEEEPAPSEAVVSSAQEPKMPAKEEEPKPSPTVKEVKKSEPIAEVKKAEKPEPAKPVPPVQKKKNPQPPKTTTKIEKPNKETVKAEPVEKPRDVIAEFGEVKITQETYNQTKTEMEEIVDSLNHITATKDYGRWVSFLSKSYRQKYSEPAILRRVSDALPVKGIKLKTLKDYFTYVFVPSRQNIRVDDIRFLSPTRVDVIMKHGRDSLLVYCLENINGEWKLVSHEL